MVYFSKSQKLLYNIIPKNASILLTFVLFWGAFSVTIWYNFFIMKDNEKDINLDNNGISQTLFDKWDDRFMQVARLVSSWSSCIRPNRQIGAVIVQNKRIVTTGYNGAPSGIKTCAEKGYCMREQMGIQSGTRTEMCYAAHAEQNAIVQAARLGISIDKATLYCTHQPCVICAKLIINSGINRVVYEQGYPDAFARELFKEANVKLEQYKKK